MRRTAIPGSFLITVTLANTLACLLQLAVPTSATTFLTVTPRDDLRSIIESTDDNTVINLSAGTFQLAHHAPYGQPVLIENKSDLTIPVRNQT